MTQKMYKYTLALTLTALILLSGFSGVLQHLLCDHCDVASLFQTEQLTSEQAPSCCAKAQAGFSAQRSADDSHCLCEHASDEATTPAKEVEAPESFKLSPALFKGRITMLFAALLSTESHPVHPIPTSIRIASSREILALNAILLI